MSTCSTARMASRFSVIDTGSPAARSSCTKPWSTSSIVRSVSSISSAQPCLPPEPAERRAAVDAELLARLGEIRLVLEQHVQRVAERLGLDLDPVGLVDEQHDRFLRTDRFEQRPREQERLREDVGLDGLPIALVFTVGLDAQELLLVVPLVERLAFVETLVALEADEA